MAHDDTLQKESKKIVVSNGSRFQETSRTAAVFFALSTGATILVASGRFGFIPYAVPAFSIVSLVLGAVAWKFHRDAADLKVNVDHFLVKTSEKAYYMELLGKILTWCEGPPYTRDDLVRGIHDWIVANAKSDDLLAEWTALLPSDSLLAPGRAYRAFRRLRLLWLWQKVSPIALYFFGRRLRSDYLVAGMIGSEDFQRLNRAQGFEHGVVEEIE